MVRGAVKLQEARASQVRCTCSMQGLKAQKTPSGRRHASADLTTCASELPHQIPGTTYSVVFPDSPSSLTCQSSNAGR